MDSDDFFEHNPPCPNFIDGELERKIREITKGHDVAVIVSSGLNIVNGFYSTEQPRISTYNPQVCYNGKAYWAENIAELMHRVQHKDFDALTQLQQMYPYVLASSSEPTKSGFRFKMLVAGEIPEESRNKIITLVEQTWEAKAGYELKLA